MKTRSFDLSTALRAQAQTPAIVQLADNANTQSQTPLVADEAELARAKAFAAPLLENQSLGTGENALAHADHVANILQGIGAAPSMLAAVYLVYAAQYLSRPEEVLKKSFGPSYASLVVHTRKLMQIQQAAREAKVDEPKRAEQTERVRKMLLAFSHDLRVVLLRLASRLQTLRYFAQSKIACPLAIAQESMQVFAPLANRLGIWQIKWELEDLSFRFLEPDKYKNVAKLLDEKRLEREHGMEAFRQQLSAKLTQQGVLGQVQARPKHLYSIWRKMCGKDLSIDQVLDVRALRVVVQDVPDCYAVLSHVHACWQQVSDQFDDYIARPKPNGYQSLHTVVLDEQNRAVEVQIRTQAMHEHAEHGVAAHWAYKEAGTKGYAGAVSAPEDFNTQVTEARKTVLRQLLAWQRDFTLGASSDQVLNPVKTQAATALFDDRIYVFTPQAAVIDLPVNATPIDFAYAVHTLLGHRCRGAKVDGVMVPLNTPLQSGQTVDIISVKEGGPSMDWINPDLAYLQSHRSRAKVRAWFNGLAQQHTIARGREMVEKLLQREGRTALKFDDLANQLGFRQADALFEVVGKDEFSLSNIQALFRPLQAPPSADEVMGLRSPVRTNHANAQSGVLVVGVESLLTHLAHCCRPAPPDIIGGYVTRGRGVAIHRADCSNFQNMCQHVPERGITVAWGHGAQPQPGATLYPVDVMVEATDRQGLLRDISEVFAKEKINVIGVNTQSKKELRGGTAWMGFTVEINDVIKLKHVLSLVAKIEGVRVARRR
jgi:GTP pyrophosphokinase